MTNASCIHHTDGSITLRASLLWVEQLEREVKAWQEARYAKEVKIKWRFTTADAHIKLKHLYPSLEV